MIREAVPVLRDRRILENTSFSCLHLATGFEHIGAPSRPAPVIYNNNNEAFFIAPQNAKANSAAHVSQKSVDPEENMSSKKIYL